MPSSYNIADIAYSEALSGTLPTVAASARPVSLNRVLRSDLGWIDTLHVSWYLYIVYTYIFLSCWWKQTHLFETSTLRLLCVTWRCWRITMLQSVRPWNLRRLEDLEVKRENPRNLQVCRQLAYILDWGHHSHHREATGSHRAYCWEPLGCIQNSKCHVEIFKLHNLRFGQDGAERGLFGRYFVLVIPFFPKYTNDCIYLCLYINLHKSTEMKVIGKFVGIGSFATKSSNQDHHFHIHIFAGSRCKSCGRGLTFVHRAPGMVELATSPSPAAAAWIVSKVPGLHLGLGQSGSQWRGWRDWELTVLPVNRVDPMVKPVKQQVDDG